MDTYLNISRAKLSVSAMLFSLTFVAAACGFQLGERSIINTEWKWSEIEYPTSTTIIQNPSNYTLRLRANGSFEVKANCNIELGTYVLENEAISFQFDLTPRRLNDCEDGTLVPQYIINLRLVESYKLEDGHLYLYTENGRAKMAFYK
jgi:hypothetical protein